MIDWLVELQPRSVLDIGVGFGKWGFLAREYLDVNAERYKLRGNKMGGLGQHYSIYMPSIVLIFLNDCKCSFEKI